VLRRQYATMRRHIINAKIDSDDLGSFLYRLFRRHEFHRLLGAEAASVFALDHRSAMLHLRGTTGLAADAHMSDQLSCRGRLQRFQRFPSTRAADRLPRRERAAAGQECRAYHGRPVHQGLLAAASEAHIQSQRHHPRGAPCIGVIRLVNRIHVRDGHTPFTWLPVCCLIYAAESLYNVIESFIATDEASFNKDAAFHGAMSIVDTIAKNIDIVRRSIFKDIYPEDRSINRLFHLSPVDGSASTSYPDQIKVILNTAYASARALSFQIDRASIGLQRNTEVWTHKLITDVLIRAFEMIGDMCISHSANEPIIRPSATKLLEAKERPPSVRGSPEALTSVFANLCENSVKYRQPRKPIHIDVGFDIQPSHVEVQFRDYGIGILHGEEERIFTRGYRTPRARDFAVRGNGLGLSWCREVLEHFKGSITAKRHDDGLEVIVRLSRK
jgi:Histidine kinase-, DNA gyrase B-, and HSP90-like ATPase